MNSNSEDILREVFKCCLDSRFPHVQPFSPAEAPLLLCGVCIFWRAIALTTPQLWERLSICIGRESSDKAQPSQQLIKTWIARSGARPLTLVLKDLGLRSSVDIANNVLRIFLPHIHRWQSITFLLPNYPLPSALIGLGRLCDASQLQIANLEFGADPGFQTAGTPQVAGLAGLLTASSQLHTLYYRNDPCTLRFLDISWAHLTVIDLVPVWSPMSQIIDIMQKAPKLRSLSVFIAETCNVARPLLLPDLVILWIGSEVDLGPLFEQLTLPSLSNVNVFCGNTVPPQTDVINCVARSGCSLQIAIFKSLRISKAHLLTFLRLSPALLLFEFSDGGAATITDDILELLTAGTTSYLCPDLRIIRFLESSVSSTDGLLADMVVSRRAKGSPPSLSCLVVDFSDADLPTHAADIRRLKGLEEAPGFRVWINEPETE